MLIIFPKNATNQLKQQTQKTIKKVEVGLLRLRRTRYGYKTIAIGRCERAVFCGDTCYVFSKHSEYERFIDKPAA